MDPLLIPLWTPYVPFISQKVPTPTNGLCESWALSNADEWIQSVTILDAYVNQTALTGADATRGYQGLQTLRPWVLHQVIRFFPFSTRNCYCFCCISNSILVVSLYISTSKSFKQELAAEVSVVLGRSRHRFDFGLALWVDLDGYGPPLDPRLDPL
jgi:hypothetical protein